MPPNRSLSKQLTNEGWDNSFHVCAMRAACAWQQVGRVQRSVGLEPVVPVQARQTADEWPVVKDPME
ncbi:unnamed protein product [Rotaria sordida]|uniref:Uncharacterized protein n=1 Tax=Rotaria sordida TaxID=392033 RepID=A0A815QDF9_9BILA|nr:unnamed protein product [Rotaria sordida]